MPAFATISSALISSRPLSSHVSVYSPSGLITHTETESSYCRCTVSVCFIQNYQLWTPKKGWQRQPNDMVFKKKKPTKIKCLFLKCDDQNRVLWNSKCFRLIVCMCVCVHFLNGHLYQFSSVQSLSRVRLFVTPWITAHQASLSITNSRS